MDKSGAAVVPELKEDKLTTATGGWGWAVDGVWSVERRLGGQGSDPGGSMTGLLEEGHGGQRDALASVVTASSLYALG